ncbi:MAG: YbaN family protein [Clostridia bacterium]|nr:YbaN family protein [Clostridia bacterium]
MKRAVWIVVGSLSFVLGTLGIFLPILPTVPLYLLASFSFLNSSEKLYKKFKSGKLYKRYLLKYLAKGGLSLHQKVLLILFVSCQIAIAAFLLKNSILGLIVVFALYIGFLVSMLFIVKTVPPEK